MIELEDMETIYKILIKHPIEAQRRMLEWVVKFTDEENNKKQHIIKQEKIGQLMSEDLCKEKAK